jgi:hypothetical protein
MTFTLRLYPLSMADRDRLVQAFRHMPTSLTQRYYCLQRRCHHNQQGMVRGIGAPLYFGLEFESPSWLASVRRDFQVSLTELQLRPVQMARSGLMGVGVRGVTPIPISHRDLWKNACTQERQLA